MSDSSLEALLGLAVTAGLLHTIAGPDHYVPFVVLARARRWSWPRTALVTVLCGIGHVAASLLLGTLGIGVGMAVFRLQRVEAARAQIAAWLLIGFGLVYAAWGLRHAGRRRRHCHRHFHPSSGWHAHAHDHAGSHLHVHESAAGGASRSLTPWVLFLVFVFGPCEALIPLLMVPAARSDWTGVAVVTGVFGAVTILTMLGLVMALSFGLKAVRFGAVERYAHALAGLTLALCGLLVLAGF